MCFRRLRNRVLNFWMDFSDDVRGLEALQIVMVLAIAAVCLIAVKAWWTPLSKYFNSLFEILLFQ